MRIAFTFTVDDEKRIEYETFDVTDTLQTDADTWADEWIEENPDYSLHSMEPVEWDEDGDPNDFDGLNEYGKYVELLEKHGPGYKLRYEDVHELTDSQFQEQYQGYWTSAAAFVESLINELYEIPDHLRPHINWDSYARDIMMDYSEYDGDVGVYIFRN